MIKHIIKIFIFVILFGGLGNATNNPDPLFKDNIKRLNNLLLQFVKESSNKDINRKINFAMLKIVELADQGRDIEKYVLTTQHFKSMEINTSILLALIKENKELKAKTPLTQSKIEIAGAGDDVDKGEITRLKSSNEALKGKIKLLEEARWEHTNLKEIAYLKRNLDNANQIIKYAKYVILSLLVILWLTVFAIASKKVRRVIFFLLDILQRGLYLIYQIIYSILKVFYRLVILIYKEIKKGDK